MPMPYTNDIVNEASSSSKTEGIDVNGSNFSRVDRHPD